MDVRKANRDELRAYAREHKIPGYSKLKADELRSVVGLHLSAPRSAGEVSQVLGSALDDDSHADPLDDTTFLTGPLGTYCNHEPWAPEVET